MTKSDSPTFEPTAETPVIRDEPTGHFAMGSARPSPARGPERTATTPANAAVATTPKTTQSEGKTPVQRVTLPPAPLTSQTTAPVAVTPRTTPWRGTSVPRSATTTIEAATSVPSSSPQTTARTTSPPATGWSVGVEEQGQDCGAEQEA